MPLHLRRAPTRAEAHQLEEAMRSRGRHGHRPVLTFRVGRVRTTVLDVKGRRDAEAQQHQLHLPRHLV